MFIFFVFIQGVLGVFEIYCAHMNARVLCYSLCVGLDIRVRKRDKRHEYMDSGERIAAEAGDSEERAARANYARAWRMALIISGALDWGIIAGWGILIGASIALGGALAHLHWLGPAAASIRLAAILASGGNLLMGVSDVAESDEPVGSELFAAMGRIGLFVGTIAGVAGMAIWGGVLLSRLI